MVFGFSDEKKMDKWLKEKNLYEKHKEHKDLLEKFRSKKRSPEEWDRIKQSQIKRVKKHTDRYLDFLKKHNLMPDQHKKIREKILESYDEFFPPKIESIYLYDGYNYTGAILCLEGGQTYCGKHYPRYYPDFGYFGWDNRASSLSFNCKSTAYVYSDDHYKDHRLWVDCNLPDLRWAWWWLGGMNNRLSSAIVYGD